MQSQKITNWLISFIGIGLAYVLTLFPNRPPLAPTIPMPFFVDIAPRLGVNLVYDMYGPNLADYNRDGLLDLTFTNHNPALTLFKQESLWDFTDIAPAAGIPLLGDKHGASWGDCNNDGRLDLYLTRGYQENDRLFYNSGDDAFTNIANSAGVETANRGRSVSWIDYDNDGHLDLYVTNREDTNDLFFRSNGNCSFTDVTNQTGDLTLEKHPRGVSWADYDNDGDMDVFSSGTFYDGSRLYRNNGDGTFTDVTTSAGILDPRATGIAWGDYDNDGDLDLFLTQGRGYANSVISELTNFLYQNNGDGTFTEVGAAAGVSSSLNSHAATWADFDLDGDLDLYVSNSGTQTAGSQPNFLYKNLGNGTFTDVAPLVGATGSTVDVSGGIAVGDVNADGFLDIVIVHGVPTFEMFPGANEVLLNEGNGTHWLQIKLVGKKSNRLGIGARVELTAPDGLYQMREMNGGIHNFSQDEMLLTFGLGWRTSISQLTIYWPSGIVQVITNLSVNKRIEISECAPCSLPPPNQPNNTPSR